MHGTHWVPRTIVALLCILTAACGDGTESRLGDGDRIPKLKGPELVPQELVAALLSGMVAPSRAAEIVVGRVPDDMPFEVPRPPNARVVGALARADNGTIVLSVAERPLEAAKAYRDLLRSTGWDDRGSERGGGFQPSPILYSGAFCRGDNAWITTTAAERSDRETFLQIRYAKGDKHSPCDERQRDNMSFVRGPMPTLYPHPEASILDASAGGSRNYMEASARLRTDVQPGELVAHYAAQLRADGWTPRSQPAGASVVGQTWGIQDRRGRAWTGVLIAIALPESDQRELLFRVVPQDVER